MSDLQLVLAADAINDIDHTVGYYNSVSDGLALSLQIPLTGILLKSSRYQQLRLPVMIRYGLSQ